uniref:hypothetical protein n=1 Tax=Trichocoleus desertorum TaxID=1481672 RepID=UPI0025B5A502|nr:hypothetical protein [Trichocoleus desertorum]
MINFYKISLAVLATGSVLLGLSSCSPSDQASDRTDSSTPNSQTNRSAIQAPAAVPSITPTPQAKASPAPTAATRSQSLNTSSRNTPSRNVAATTTANTQNTNAQNTVPVTIYKVDSNCETLVPQPATVSAQQPIEAAISQTLAQWDTADFSLTGYRVSINPDSRVATVDLRVSPNSRRQLESLSSCEQLALLGAVNKTLTANPQWKIESVRFTEKGEEVAL